MQIGVLGFWGFECCVCVCVCVCVFLTQTQIFDEMFQSPIPQPPTAVFPIQSGPAHPLPPLSPILQTCLHTFSISSSLLLTLCFSPLSLFSCYQKFGRSRGGRGGGGEGRLKQRRLEGPMVLPSYGKLCLCVCLIQMKHFFSSHSCLTHVCVSFSFLSPASLFYSNAQFSPQAPTMPAAELAGDIHAEITR